MMQAEAAANKEEMNIRIQAVETKIDDVKDQIKEAKDEIIAMLKSGQPWSLRGLVPWFTHIILQPGTILKWESCDKIRYIH